MAVLRAREAIEELPQLHRSFVPMAVEIKRTVNNRLALERQAERVRLEVALEDAFRRFRKTWFTRYATRTYR